MYVLMYGCNNVTRIISLISVSGTDTDSYNVLKLYGYRISVVKRLKEN